MLFKVFCKILIVIFYITDFDYMRIWFLRAFLAVSAEEESLPAMIPDALVDLTLQVSALSITLQYARLKVLLEPIGIGQR